MKYKINCYIVTKHTPDVNFGPGACIQEICLSKLSKLDRQQKTYVTVELDVFNMYFRLFK